MPELVRLYGAGSIDSFVLPGEAIPESWRDAGVRTIAGDIADGAAVRAAVSGHRVVVHLAGVISYAKGDGERLRRVNEDGVRAVVEAFVAAGVGRLIHVSYVGAVGFREDGSPPDETVPFNWPEDILYMVSKLRGQDIVERAVRERGLKAVIFNPASIMGPGDRDPATPHNALYRRISGRTQIGSFSGGLAIVDVRDLVAVILKAVEGRGRDGESYLVVGANLAYGDVIRRIARAAGRRAFPFPVPAPLLAAAGRFLEWRSRRTGRPPLLTAAYGRLSGWTAYYDTQTHREMASGLSTPVGFKNGTDGGLDVAINAIRSARSPHSFLGIGPNGRTAIVRTRGNRLGHLVLRGGGGRPNYDTVSVRLAESALVKAGLAPNIVVDCSHSNSLKDPSLQPLVFMDCVHQIKEGNRSVVGLMLESHLHGGSQAIPADLAQLKYGVSVTDACIDWPTTAELLLRAAGVLRSVLPARAN